MELNCKVTKIKSDGRKMTGIKLEYQGKKLKLQKCICNIKSQKVKVGVLYYKNKKNMQKDYAKMLNKLKH